MIYVEELGPHIIITFTNAQEEALYRSSLEVYKAKRRFVKGGYRWLLYNNPDNKSFANSIIAKKKADAEAEKRIEHLESLTRVTFDYTDVLVRSNSCKSHKLTEYAGEVPVFLKDGRIQHCLISIFYCHDCQCIFTYEQTVEELKRQGVIACKVMDYTIWKLQKDNPAFRPDWRKISPLRMQGYCVNKNEDLSEEQRRFILVNLIEKGIMTKSEIESYLNFFLRKMGNAGPDAHEKWRQDYKFISQYKLGTRQIVTVSGLIYI